MRTQYKDSEYPLTMNEVSRLFGAATSFRDRLIAETAYYVALRRFEIAKLDIRDIDFERGRISIIGKGTKLGVIPVGSVYPQYLNNLKLFIGKRQEGPVFKSNRGNNLSISMPNKIIAKLGKAAHLKNPNPKKKYINPQCLRHSQARHLKDLGLDTEFVQYYLRHASYKTTMDTYGQRGIEGNERYAQKLLPEGQK